MPCEPLRAAALVLGHLVPGCVETDTNGNEFVRALEPIEYDQLSSGERAAYELAYEFQIGGGALTRYVLAADLRYANAMVTAVHVALGPVLVPAS